MKRILSLVVLAAVIAGSVFAGGAGEDKSKPVTFVWLPNESGEEIKSAREAIGALVEKTLGRKVIHRLTTDYIIAVESMANNQSHLGFLGAEAYVQANAKNKKVMPLALNSPSTNPAKPFEGAVYYSWIAVKKGNEGMYQSGSGYSLNNIAGKRFGFVSTSSTSGFRVPSSSIVKIFSAMPKWKSLKSTDLLEGGPDKLFSEVSFGASHQGTAVQLLTGKTDVAVFCDTCVDNYVQLSTGKANAPGSVYVVRSDAVDPFTPVQGQEFVILSATAVLNSPMVVNASMFSNEELKALRNAFTAESTAMNTAIFPAKGSTVKAIFKAGERFVALDDSFFDPLRAMSK